jgi:hypothetical protein
VTSSREKTGPMSTAVWWLDDRRCERSGLDWSVSCLLRNQLRQASYAEYFRHCNRTRSACFAQFYGGDDSVVHRLRIVVNVVSVSVYATCGTRGPARCADYSPLLSPDKKIIARHSASSSVSIQAALGAAGTRRVHRERKRTRRKPTRTRPA